MQLNEIGRWIGESFRNPRETASAFVREDWPQGVEWLALAAIAVLAAIVNAISVSALGPSVSMIPAISPVFFAVFSAATTIVFAGGCFFVGRWMGSPAAFRPILLVVIWLQFLQLAVQVFSIILTLTIPGLGTILSLILSIWVLWLIVVWMDTIWGWKNPLKSLAAILLTILAIGVVASIFLSSFGMTAMPDMPRMQG